MNKFISNSMIVMAVCMLLNTCANKDAFSEFDDFHNRVIPVESEAKTATYMLYYNIGHRYSDCQGKCVTIQGKDYHIDCMGYGNICVRTTNVTFQQVGTNIIATTTDTFGLTTEDFFLMPDRSLSYTDENNNRMYLNIPEQLVYRDSTTKQFTFTGLFFSDDAVYTND